jgi:maltoporin
MMKKYPVLLFLLFYSVQLIAQVPVVTNKMFSFGTYGRAGIASGIGIEGKFPRSLNLNGMGSIGGRFEESDYMELASAMHFKPVVTGKDTTFINVQTRFAFFTTQGQIIGNVTSKSLGGITTALPELYAEAKNINGSQWTVWIGARLYRGDDIHIIDHFYFDDHGGQGFGIKHKYTQFSVIFPGSVDTTSTIPPYYYNNIVNGTPVLGLRNRAVFILEHELTVKNGYVKLLGEMHRLASGESADKTSSYNYPSDVGFVAGVKYFTNLNGSLPGSSNAASIRVGTGIANGGDGGGSKTFLTYGGPNLQTNSFRKAWSIAATETFLLNISNAYSLNAYGIFTKSRGASDSLNRTPDYTGKQMLFNRKTDVALGARGTWYISDVFHLLHEFDLAWRKDGTQDFAQMTKFTIAPTIVPGGQRDVWCRPHFRFVYSIAHYNQFAADHLYSPYLAQSGTTHWGHYVGVKAEWWIW